MPSNQGSEMIDQVLDDVSSFALAGATTRLRKEMERHPGFASCDCPTIEALCFFV